ncbi:MAG: cytidylate kinase family protein [Nanoarchaeota archaeon]|nr:cytidylate kinase family protein [Nanoarchaeota archaeon]
MIITISGKPGSGKSTLAKMLAEKYGLKHYSVGELRRKWAEERSITIAELNKLGEGSEWTDKDADEYQKELGTKEDDFVIDSRLGFHFIPKSYKIFLDVDLKKAAERVSKDHRRDENGSEEELHKLVESRMESDILRYKRYYGLDPFDPKHYDIVIDTTDKSPEEVLEITSEDMGQNPP